MSRSKRSRALVGAAVVVIALLAGCSGSGETPADTPAAQNSAAVTDDPGAAALLAAASEATVAAGTAKYELQMHVETGGRQTTVSGQQYDPAQQLATLQKVSNDVRMVGTEQLRGTEVRHVAFTIDPAALAAASGMAGDSATALQSGGPIPGDLWVDEEGRVRKLQMLMTMNQNGTVSTMDVISEYFEFGVPVTVQRPDPATVQGPAGGR